MRYETPWLGVLAILLGLSACGGGGDGGGGYTPPGGGGTPPSVSVGGTIRGLIGSVVLQNNAGDDLTVSADGAFQFHTAIPGSTAYNVTVKTQPPNVMVSQLSTQSKRR